jgi:hypothetical protein
MARHRVPFAFVAGRPRSQGDVARDHGAARQYHLYDRIRATKTAELPDVLEDEFAPLADLAELIQHGGALRGIGGRAFRRSTDIFLISASSTER